MKTAQEKTKKKKKLKNTRSPIIYNKNSTRENMKKREEKKKRSIKKTKEKESLFNNVDKMSISIINIYRRVNNIT